VSLVETLLLERTAYVVVALLVGIGLFVLVDADSLVVKVLGLNLFQTGVFLFFVAAAFRADGRAPLVGVEGPHVNPLPHVLILTAIVVGVSVTAVALSLVVRIHDAYGTVSEAALAARLDRTGGSAGETGVDRPDGRGEPTVPAGAPPREPTGAAGTDADGEGAER
jgi:multicomponent Na+:H+ antiporter subunit C